MAKTCAQCGSELREGARVCTQCGTPVATAPQPTPTAAQTMIGFTSPLAPKVDAPKSQQQPPAPAPAAAPPMMQTMLGFSAPDLGIPPAPAPAPAPVPVGAKTMLGIAAPGIAPLAASAPAPVPAPEPAPAPKAALGGTMLGIAMPGIAPLHSQPGTAPPAVAPPQAPLARTMVLEQAPIVPAPAPLAREAAPAAPVVVARRGIPLALVAVLALLLVVGVGGAILYFSRGAPPMTATAKVSADGKEELHLVCAGCPDGTKATWQSHTATFAKNEADLELPSPLAIGDNRFDIALDRPGVGRDETVKLVLPLAYRIRGDLSGIGATPPVVRVDVEALPGSTVTVDGKPVALDASGKATLTYDVTADTTGAADETRTIERKMPYEVVGKDAKKSTGEVAIRVAVLPLHVDAPTASLVTDQATLWIAGKTAKGAVVTANGKSLAVDADGSFEGPIDLAAGEQPIAIRTAPAGDASTKAAPRSATLTIKRVASLADEAATLEKTAALDAAALTRDPTAAEGQSTAIAGPVVDARATHHRTALLVDDKRGCAKGASCLVRVDYGGDLDIRAGDTIDAFGVATKPIATSDGKTVPAVLASIVRKTKR
ncbi:MAG TPA: zinc-ribbon domain-containing protein [Polyangiaceae bacterium]|jgi:hypothetical protein